MRYSSRVYWKQWFSSKIEISTRIVFNSKSKLSIGSLHFRRGVTLNINNGELIIGMNLFVNNYSSINCQKKISIGDNCLFGEGVKIYDHDHIFNSQSLIYKSGFKTKAVSIGDNVWIGSNSIILKGTNIGNNSVIGAGMVITGNIPENSIVYRTNTVSMEKIIRK